MPKSPKLGKITFSSLTLQEQIQMSNLQDAVNILGGHSGEIELSNHLSLGGKKIKNVAPPSAGSDVLTSEAAEASYSASALQPKLEAGSSNPMVSYRQMNNSGQREQISSFLNDLLSTPPNANSINPIVSTSGGFTTITIPASIIQMADGSTLSLPARTDIVANPAKYTILSFSVTGEIATVDLTATPSPPLTADTIVYIAGTGEIDGTYPILSILSATSFTINTASSISGLSALIGDVVASGPGVASATVVGVNSALVPASETYIGTNASGQIVSAPTPSLPSNFVENEILGGSGTAWTFSNPPISSLPTSTSVQLYVEQYPGGPFVRLPKSAITSITGNNMVTAASWSAGALMADYQW